MAGGVLYQISNYNFNSKNNYLELDPQISFFKIVFRRYTRFAVENITLDNLSRSKIDYTNTTNISSSISRYADLLSQLYFTFELPDIYSGNYTNETYTQNFEFRWIENIGINIFNSISFNINNLILDSLTNDSMYLYKELHLNNDEKELFNKNIGHIKELYDPANAPGQNGLYPHTTKGLTKSLQSDKYDNFQSKIVTINDSNVNGNISFPSILKRKIKVPLPFFFSINSGLSLPLIALQYSKLNIKMELKAFKDLYVFKDPKYTSTNSPSLNKLIKPGDDTHHKIKNFTLDNYDFDIKPKLEGEFIYLDEDERKRFALYDHEYLITQNKIMNDDKSIPSSVTTKDFKITMNNPVKYIAFFTRRDDFKHINIYNNFTNWIYPNIPPYSAEYTYKDKYYNIVESKDTFYNNSIATHKDFFDTTYLRKNIITNFEMKFDGQVIVDKNIEYFENQQKLKYFKHNTNSGIYVYSFSLNPHEYQPSGSCNFDSINKAIVKITQPTMNTANTDTIYHNSNLYIYGINYNILVVKNGLAKLKFD